MLTCDRRSAPVKEVFDQFVIAVAQQAILSPSDGAELAFNADVADLQPVAVRPHDNVRVRRT